MTNFTGIKGKTSSPFATLSGYLEAIFEAETELLLTEQEIPQEVSLEMLNLLLGVYNHLENTNQKHSRTGVAVHEVLVKVKDAWLVKK